MTIRQKALAVSTKHCCFFLSCGFVGLKQYPCMASLYPVSATLNGENTVLFKEGLSKQTVDR